jgi:predicted kinase
LPLFLAMRASVRAKVELLRSGVADVANAGTAQAEAKAYCALAAKFLAPAPPRLIAIGGLSGSGKSAVARAIAPFIGAFPGAVHVRSDIERKRLFGVAAQERLSASAYASEISDRVYSVCRKRATMALEGGQPAILDAVHAKEEEREATAQVASDLRVPFAGIWLDAPAELLRKRVAERSGDVSDATPEIVDAQLGYEIGRQSFQTVDAGRPLDQVVAECLRLIGVDPRERS